jgi:NAD(P)-dependent dehydrogenase (short-subunit alcohol dehydrogenase family)
MGDGLAGRAALVTGASRGIGAEIARQLADEGARIAVHYHRGQNDAEKVVGQLPGAGHALVQADVADPDDQERLVEETAAALGRIDLLINNAGVFEFHPPAQTDLAKWRDAWTRTLNLNLVGPAALCHLAARRMMTQGGGKIINVSSRGAFRGEPDAPAYGASKAGLNAMGQSLAQALAPHRVFVYTVAPGFTETDMAAVVLDGPNGDAVRNQSPLGRAARPDEVARTVVFLAKDGVDFLTGAIIDVNGASYLRT